MVEKIYVDDAGKEIKREPMTKGRMPIGAKKQENGDWIITMKPATLVKPQVYYVTTDEGGNEIVADLKDKNGKSVSRVEKGRGKNKPGYALKTDGTFKDNWVKIIVPKAETVVVSAPTEPAAV